MTGARTNTLATFARQHRAHRGAMARRMRLHSVALGHAERRCGAAGRPCARPRCMRCLPKGRQSAAATGFIAGLAGRVTARRPLVWVRQDFAEIESGALSMSGLGRTRPRSAPAGDGARRRCRHRAADRRRCAGLRCARRRGAGSLGRGAAARSRRQPQADPGGASLRRHRACCCGSRRTPQPSTAETRWIVRAAHSPPAVALAARGARRCSTRNSSATVMARSGDGSWNGNVMSAFSANRRRILSLWLPRLPIDRIKRQLAQTARRTAQAFPSEVDTGSREDKRVDETTDDQPLHRRRQGEQRAADLRAGRCGRAVSALRSACRSPMPARSVRELTVFDADEAADAKR